MLYATKDKLYTRTASGFSEVYVTVEGGSLSVTEVGKQVNSRPYGATPLLHCELIAQFGLEEGDVYPRRVVKPVQRSEESPIRTRK